MVEANLDLRSVQYVVFDEADRLFEMGFDMSAAHIAFLRSKLRRKNETAQNEIKRENHLL